MAGTISSAGRKIWQTLSAIKTGVILLILVVVVSAAGTVILQRPATDADEMQRAYSPQMLRLLDAFGLTNVFHAWWFLLLLVMVSLSIIAASIQRFPNSWRYYARPYKNPDESFRRANLVHAEIAIADEEQGLKAAEKVFRKAGLKPERIVGEQSFSLFGERHRISEMAVYIVHASLLLIFLGGIVDGLYGWSGFLMLASGQSANSFETRGGGNVTLPFAIRCDGAGQENYADGTPRKWWSKLTVLQGGESKLQKEIVVNDPLVYGGVRFYQASFGETGKVESLKLTASRADGTGQAKDITLTQTNVVQLDADTSIRMTEFIPDYVVRDGQVYTRSTQLGNPAVHLVVDSKKLAKPVNVWLPPIPGFEENAASAYKFDNPALEMEHFTGLQVSHEPGQWAVWSGVVLMGFGLVVVFYLDHMRIWVVPVRDAGGQLKLWIGGASNKNRDVFEQRFRKIVNEIEVEVGGPAQQRAQVPVAVFAGR
jgi:cytochrome c biogenesis protein